MEGTIALGYDRSAREDLLPALPAIKEVALAAGARGRSLDGSGASVFASLGDEDTDVGEFAMRRGLMVSREFGSELAG